MNVLILIIPFGIIALVGLSDLVGLNKSLKSLDSNGRQS